MINQNSLLNHETGFTLSPRWLIIAQQLDPDNWVDLPSEAIRLHDNGISITYHAEEAELVFKRSIPFLIENEFWCLRQMQGTSYVPTVERYDKYTIMMPFIENEFVTKPNLFTRHRVKFLKALRNAGIRHGDLTTPNVLVNENRPIVIDWAESRRWGDMRVDKRTEGDSHWSKVTWEILCQAQE